MLPCTSKLTGNYGVAIDTDAGQETQGLLTIGESGIVLIYLKKDWRLFHRIALTFPATEMGLVVHTGHDLAQQARRIETNRNAVSITEG